jgi:hypothetical protein
VRLSIAFYYLGNSVEPPTVHMRSSMLTRVAGSAGASRVAGGGLQHLGGARLVPARDQRRQLAAVSSR